MKIYNLAFLLLFLYPFTSPIKDSQQKLIKNKPVTNIVFKSIDGGQTWQDISEGLPENLKDDLWTDDFFVNESGLHLRSNNDEIYHNKPNSTTPFWKKESSPYKQVVQKTKAMSAWSPMYTNFKKGAVNTVFETAGGSVFIGSDNGLFKSIDKGKTWKQVYTGGWGAKLVESNGVLMATSQEGILRSTDDGENWKCVLNEGGVGIAVESIKGGFAAINYNTLLGVRKVRTSYDGGKTWQAIDAGLPPDLSIASIIQVGEYFFCGHPAGIYRSADKGKTWKLLLPSVENKVFNLFISGNVIYAIPLNGGC